MFNPAGINRSLLAINRINNIHLARSAHHKCKVLVVGGGTGGCSMAAKFARKFDKAPNHVIVIEPSDVHYYQPLYTLIGAGISKFSTCRRPMKSVLPKKAQWLRDRVISFEPNENKVTTQNGDTVNYEHMIVAVGLDLLWDQLPGLIEGIKNPDSQVCSIYGFETVTNVFDKIRNTSEGNAYFTLPNTPVKCPGAPQKIAYLSEDYWGRKNTRKNINVIYNTSLPTIFTVKKYADSLTELCNRRNIIVNFQTNLIEIRPDKKEAVFQDLAKPENKQTVHYALLHVTPPMGPPEILKKNKKLTNEAGFLDVDQYTLQHKKFKNVYGLGDCTSTPNSKTMAAITTQSKILYNNMMSNMQGKKMECSYNGYAACPLVTAPGKCILSEFDYDLQPQETFPVDQGKELYSMYLLKKHFFPFLYWNFILKGYWNGPEMCKKTFDVVKKKDTVPTAVKR